MSAIETLSPRVEAMRVKDVEGSFDITTGRFLTVGDLRGAIAMLPDDMRIITPQEDSTAQDEKRVSFYGGAIVVDYEVFDVMCEDRPIETTRQEFRLFDYLSRNVGVVQDRLSILANAWDESYLNLGPGGGDRTVDVHVRRLRAKLGFVSPDYGEQNVVATRRSVGYLMTKELIAN